MKPLQGAILTSIVFLLGAFASLYILLFPTQVDRLESIKVTEIMNVYHYQTNPFDMEYVTTNFNEEVYRIEYWYGTKWVVVPVQQDDYSLIELEEGLENDKLNVYEVPSLDYYDLYNYRNQKYNVQPKRLLIGALGKFTL